MKNRLIVLENSNHSIAHVFVLPKGGNWTQDLVDRQLESELLVGCDWMVFDGEIHVGPATINPKDLR